MTQNEDQPAADGQRELRLEEELSELSELSDQPGPVEGYSAARVETVWRAVKDWTRQLIDLGGRNNLLHYRDLKTGTLDLTKAEASTLEKLLASKSVRLSSLYPDDESREQALRRARTIHKKEKENFEERGIDTLHLACGLATWENKKTAWAPLAPVLLRQATLKPIGASQEDFELSLVEEAEVNQTLVQALKRDFDCHVEEDELLEHVDGPIDEWWELDAAYKWIEGQASRVPEFNVTPRLVLANFVYAKLPMVKDLEGALEELVAHDLIAAIAGDEKAKEAVRLSMPKPEDVPAPDQVPFEDEFLILDADASQTYAINAVLAGASLIVRGPPGTGKSQTIANLVGSLVAHGKKVLFVAEKRAAIDAVLKRLRQRKLDNLVLDLHGRITSRRAFAETIGRALASSRTAGRVENKDDLRRLEKLRTELNNHLEALHAKREPWGISVFDIRTELMKVAEGQRDLRFGKDVLSGLSGDTNASAEEDLAEYAALGGTTLRSGDSPWADSHITRQEDVQEANSLVESLRRDLMPAILGSLADASVAAGLPQATSLDDWKPRLALSNKIDRMLDSFESGIYELEFDEFTQSLSPAQKGGLARISASIFSTEYKNARAEVRALCRPNRSLSDRELLRACEAAGSELKKWRRLGGEGLPRALGGGDLASSYERLQEKIEELENWIGKSSLGSMPIDDLNDLIESLAGDRTTLVKLPRIEELRTTLVGLGLETFINDADENSATEEECLISYRYCWLHSILDEVSLLDMAVGGFVAAKSKAKQSRTSDLVIEHISSRHLRGSSDLAPSVR